MDLIAALSEQLGVPPEAAKAVAGAALGGAEEALPEEHADALKANVPELASWKTAAAGLLSSATGAAPAPAAPAAGGLGGLLGGSAMSSLAGALGGESAQQQLAVVQALSSLGVDASKAALIGPLVLQFAEDRLDPSTVKQLVAALPMLGGAKSSDALGSLSSLGRSFF